jgi:CDP-4-dehydro-6-deoxyglucose reductase
VTLVCELDSFEDRYTVVGRQQCTPAIVELWLRPSGVPAQYRPGQYVLVDDEDQTWPQRSYSIANAPRSDGLISLLITRVEDGLTSRWLHDLVGVGDHLSVSGPYGAFVDDRPEGRPALMLAAGSGLAPIRALTEAALAANGASLTLIFSARTARDIIDRELFSRWERQYPGFRYCCATTRGLGDDPNGRVPARLSVIPGGLSDHDVFIAGAPGFVQACTAAALANGARPSSVHTEELFVGASAMTT